MDREPVTIIKCRNRQISITTRYRDLQTIPPLANKNTLSGWNDRVAGRLQAFIENFRQDFTGFGTLTYGADFPTDGRVVKAHLRALVERLRRANWLGKGSLVWVLEFQARGAPHFHFVATEWISKAWLAKAWSEITGADPRSCTQIDAIRTPARIGWYLAKYLAKGEQKLVPANFEHIGRMWGCVGPKILRGRPRVPVVAAATKIPPSSCFSGILEEGESLKKVRVVRTQTGYVIHAEKEQIKWLKRRILDNIATRGRTDRQQDISIAAPLPER